MVAVCLSYRIFLSSATQAQNETSSNFLCEDDKNNGIGEALTGISYALYK